MLERLDVEPGHRILEIGAGTGYNAALLSDLAGPHGRVVSVDIDHQMASQARRALRKGDFDARVVTGDGREGWLPGAPYDRIIVTASVDRIPPAWRDQLTDGGLLEVPMRLAGTLSSPQRVVVFRRRGDRLVSTRIILGGFMGLRAAAGDPAPSGSTLAVNERIDGHSRFVALTAACLGNLPAAQRALLASAIMQEPRETQLGFRFRLWNAGLFLGLADTEAYGELMGNGPHTVGVVGPHGRGFAGVRGSSRPQQRRDVSSPLAMSPAYLVAYGGAAATRRLSKLLSEWASLGRPGDSALRVEITFDGDAPNDAWRTLRVDDSVIAFRWTPTRRTVRQ